MKYVVQITYIYVLKRTNGFYYYLYILILE